MPAKVDRFAELASEADTRLSGAISDSERSVLAVGQCVTSVLDGARDATAAARVALDSSGGESPILKAVEHQRGETERFVDDLLEQLHAQRTRAGEARSQSAEIVGIAAEVAGIAHTTKLLSFNARIEASRLGEAGRAFAVLADEMVELARSVHAANDRVSELAETLASSMPSLAEAAERLVSDSQEFGETFRCHVLELRDAESRASADVREALADNERRADATLGTAQRALSHLQFQDPMAQSLERVRHIIKALATADPAVDAAAANEGVSADACSPVAECDRIASGEATSSNVAEAGEVLLF